MKLWSMAIVLVLSASLAPGAASAEDRFAFGIGVGLVDLSDVRVDNTQTYLHANFRILLGHGRRDMRAAHFDPCQWDYRKLHAGDPNLARHLRCGLLLGGVDFMGNHAFLSTAHSDEDIDATITAFDQTIDWMKSDDLIT